MPQQNSEDDLWDGVHYDTSYDKSPAQLEAEIIRQECLEWERERAARRVRDDRM